MVYWRCNNYNIQFKYFLTIAKLYQWRKVLFFGTKHIKFEDSFPGWKPLNIFFSRLIFKVGKFVLFFDWMIIFICSRSFFPDFLKTLKKEVLAWKRFLLEKKTKLSEFKGKRDQLTYQNLIYWKQKLDFFFQFVFCQKVELAYVVEAIKFASSKIWI